jgi:RimJ/RimL family protein N-acetyltransferase
MRDFDAMCALESDPDVQKTLFGIVRTADETRERLERFIGDWERDGFGQWAFRANEDDDFVGVCGLYHGRVPHVDGLEVGYVLRPRYWGRGLATEMTTAVVRYAFDVLGVSVLCAMLQPDNAASVRVLEKSGLRRSADFVYRDELLSASFAVTRDEWLAAGARSVIPARHERGAERDQ